MKVVGFIGIGISISVAFGEIYPEGCRFSAGSGSTRLFDIKSST